MLAPCRRTPTTCARPSRPGRARARRRASSGRRPTTGWWRPTPCRGRSGAVEHVVGGDVADAGAGQAGPLGHVAGAEGVDREGPVGVALAGVDRRPRPGVHDGVGREARDGLQHGVAVGRRRALAGRPRPRRGPANACTRSWPELPAGAGDQDAQRGPPRPPPPPPAPGSGSPPRRLRGVPRHVLGQTGVESRSAVPSRAPCGSWWRRAGSAGRGPGRSGTIVFRLAGLLRAAEHDVGDLLDALLDAGADVIRLADRRRGGRARWRAVVDGVDPLPAVLGVDAYSGSGRSSRA